MINHDLQRIEVEEKRDLAKCNDLAKHIEAINKIQQMLDSIEDIPENADLIAELKAAHSELVNNITIQHNLKQEIYEKAEELLSLEVPIPPSTSDYVKEDGTLDEEAYGLALEEYENAKKEYDSKLEEYNEQQESLMTTLNELNAQVDAIMLDAITNVIEKKVNSYRENGNETKATELESRWQSLKIRYSNTQSRISALQNREAVLVNRLNSLKVPVPPATDEYLKSDGSVDEEAYSKAFEQYERKCKQYERLEQSMQNQLSQIRQILELANANLAQIQTKIEALVLD